MSYNDQESHHLLIWLNQEQLLIGERYRIYSFEQVRISKVLPSLLQKMDPHFFDEIIEAEFDYNAYFLKLEKYINQIEDMKFKRCQRQQLIESQDLCYLVKIILFLIMRHQIKEEFVSRILDLQAETQRYLMCEIKRVESWLESRVELKEVYQTIEALQTENQVLTQRLKEIQGKNSHISSFQTQLDSQNAKLSEQHRSNNTDKAQIMEELGIPHPKEYITIYNELILQRNELVASYAEEELLTTKLMQQNSQMSEKVAEDAFIIDHLACEINKYGELCSRLRKPHASVHNFSKFEKENADRSCSTTFESIRIIKSAEQIQEKDLHQDHRKVRQFDEEEQLGTIMQEYQEDLLAKLQEIYVKVGGLNNQISNLRAQNEKIISSNRRKQHTILKAYEQFHRFSQNYHLTINP